jgi:hypothetical protein
MVSDDLTEIACGYVEWIQVAQDRGCCQSGDEPSGSSDTESVRTKYRHTYQLTPLQQKQERRELRLLLPSRLYGRAHKGTATLQAGFMLSYRWNYIRIIRRK